MPTFYYGVCTFDVQQQAVSVVEKLLQNNKYVSYAIAEFIMCNHIIAFLRKQNNPGLLNQYMTLKSLHYFRTLATLMAQICEESFQ